MTARATIQLPEPLQPSPPQSEPTPPANGPGNRNSLTTRSCILRAKRGSRAGILRLRDCVFDSRADGRQCKVGSHDNQRLSVSPNSGGPWVWWGCLCVGLPEMPRVSSLQENEMLWGRAAEKMVELDEPNGYEASIGRQQSLDTWRSAARKRHR